MKIDFARSYGHCKEVDHENQIFNRKLTKTQFFSSIFVSFDSAHSRLSNDTKNHAFISFLNEIYSEKFDEYLKFITKFSASSFTLDGSGLISRVYLL